MVGVHPDDGDLFDMILGVADSSLPDHVRWCTTCTSRMHEWSAIRSGAVAASPAVCPVPEALIAGALAQVAPTPRESAHTRRTLRWAAQLLRSQVPLVRSSLAAATAIMVLLGVLVLLAAPRGRAGLVLELFAPLAAAAALSTVWGPESDPPIELVATTGTSPRTVLLARLLLVSAFDVALGLVATAITLVAATDLGFGALVAAWLGPMLLLSAVSLAISVLTRPLAGITVTLGLWTGRLLSSPDIAPMGHLHPFNAAQAEAVRDVWSTTIPVVAAAVVVFAIALAVAPRRLQFAP